MQKLGGRFRRHPPRIDVLAIDYRGNHCPQSSFQSLVILCAYVCTGHGKNVKAKMLEAVADHKVHVCVPNVHI